MRSIENEEAKIFKNEVQQLGIWLKQTASCECEDIPPQHATISPLNDCRTVLDLPSSPVFGDTPAAPRAPLAPES